MWRRRQCEQIRPQREVDRIRHVIVRRIGAAHFERGHTHDDPLHHHCRQCEDRRELKRA